MRTKYIAPILLALLMACSPTDPDSMSVAEPEAIDKPEPVAEPLVDIDLGEPEPFPEPEPEPESEAELMLIPADITVAVESLEGWRAPDMGRPFYVTTITVTLTWNMQEDHVYKLYVGEMLYHEDMRSGHEIIWEFLDRETEVQPENFPVVQIETCHKVTLQCHLSEPIDVAPEFK